MGENWHWKNILFLREVLCVSFPPFSSATESKGRVNILHRYTYNARFYFYFYFDYIFFRWDLVDEEQLASTFIPWEAVDEVKGFFAVFGWNHCVI